MLVSEAGERMSIPTMNRVHPLLYPLVISEH